MADGIITSGRHRRLLRLARFIEASFGDRTEGVDVGGGVFETRTEFRTILRRCVLKEKPSTGEVVLVFLTAPAKNRAATILAAMRQRVLDGTADDAEADAAQLSDPAAIDSSWDSVS